MELPGAVELGGLLRVAGREVQDLGLLGGIGIRESGVFLSKRGNPGGGGGLPGTGNEPNHHSRKHRRSECDYSILHSEKCSGCTSRCNSRCAP